MFFAIFAISVSIVQILLGVAIGLRLRKHRSRGAKTPPHPHMQESRRIERPAIDQHGDVANHLEATPVAALLHVNPVFQGDGAMQHQPEEPSPVNDSAVQNKEAAGGGDQGSRGRRETTARHNGQLAETNGSTSAPPPIELSHEIPAGADRRVATRRVFEYRQFVAPYNGGSLPGKASFREVECQDISPTGFSFLSSQLPDFDSLVVALGVAPHLIYVQANIVNRFQVVEGYAPVYRIGCRFAGQIS